jgi:hypothetical protein
MVKLAPNHVTHSMALGTLKRKARRLDVITETSLPSGSYSIQSGDFSSFQDIPQHVIAGKQQMSPGIKPGKLEGASSELQHSLAFRFAGSLQRRQHVMHECRIVRRKAQSGRYGWDMLPYAIDSEMMCARVASSNHHFSAIATMIPYQLFGSTHEGAKLLLKTRYGSVADFVRDCFHNSTERPMQCTPRLH